MDGFQRRGLSTGFMKPVGQRTIIEDGVPADEDAILMKSVFGLREPLAQMSPVHIPRGFTQAYIEGGSWRTSPQRIREAYGDVQGRPRHPADRGDRARRRRARSSGCPTRSSQRCSARRRSSCRRAASVARSTRSSSTRRCSSGTASRSPAPSSTRWTSTPSPAWPEPWSGALPATGSRCWASCRTVRSCRIPTLAMVLEGVRRRDDPCGSGPRPGHRWRGDRGDGARAHARSGSDRAASSSCRATGRT